MCTNDSNSGRGSKTSSPLCLPSNNRLRRDECALGIHQNTTGEDIYRIYKDRLTSCHDEGDRADKGHNKGIFPTHDEFVVIRATEAQTKQQPTPREESGSQVAQKFPVDYLRRLHGLNTQPHKRFHKSYSAHAYCKTPVYDRPPSGTQDEDDEPTAQQSAGIGEESIEHHGIWPCS